MGFFLSGPLENNSQVREVYCLGATLEDTILQTVLSFLFFFSSLFSFLFSTKKGERKEIGEERKGKERKGKGIIMRVNGIFIYVFEFVLIIIHIIYTSFDVL